MGKTVIITGFVLVNLFLFGHFFATQSYPTPLILIYCLGLVIFWSWILKPELEIEFLKKYRSDLIIILFLIVTALFIYLYRVENITPGAWGDEISFAQIGEKLVSFPSFRPFIEDNFGHPTPLFYLIGWSVKVFGRSLTAIRLPSIFFSALNIGFFYLFLRLFFSRFLALFVSLMLLFSYSYLVISRISSEIPLAIFFEILTAMMLYLAYRRNEVRYYGGAGLAVGLGLSTYLGFRTLGIFFLILGGGLIFFGQGKFKEKILLLVIFFSSALLASVPLLSYSLRHSQQIWARTNAISVFSQHLSPQEVAKEISANISNTIPKTFLFTGDPNFQHNPSSKPVFDYLTTGLFLLGAVVLFKNKRYLLFSGLFLATPIFLNDILSLEIIPEGHYYGLGHPNLLRVSGLIPIVYFILGWGLEEIDKKLSVIEKTVPIFLIGTLTLITIFISWEWYFNQPPNQYIYKVNSVRSLSVAEVINKSYRNKVYLSPTFADDQTINYFVRKNIELETFLIKSNSFSLTQLPTSSLTIIDPALNPNYATDLVNKLEKDNQRLKVQMLLSPKEEVAAIVIYRD